MKDDSFEKLLKNNISTIFKDTKINYIIKIEDLKILNFAEIKKLKVTIYDKETQEKNYFLIENDENLGLKLKIRNILTEAIKLKHIQSDSTVIFTFDKALYNEYTYGIFIIEVSRILYRIAKFKLTEFMEHELVLEKIIEICEEIRKEGREGKMIGTLFVIGDEEELKPYLKPLILNPFYGYPEELRDIINQNLNETIKEFAQLDGAFIISNKGILLSAGTYVNIDTNNVKKYLGWGTKHLTAAAITERTKSIAVVVSQSGNLIKIFKGGKLILKY